MLLSTYIKLESVIGLGLRYLKTRRRDVRAIRRIKGEYYAQTWAAAAEQTGAVIDSLGSGIFKITKGRYSMLVYHQYTPFADSVTERLIADKAVTCRLLADAGVPIPRRIILKDLDISAAKSFLAETERPVVVKPASGYGRGCWCDHQRDRSGVGSTMRLRGLERFAQKPLSKSKCRVTITDCSSSMVNSWIASSDFLLRSPVMACRRFAG